MSTKMKDQANVWRARHPRSGKIVYCVGLYNDGHYTAPNSDTIYRMSGCSAWYGPFGYGNRYHHEHTARGQARRWYGYSRIENATSALGDYLPID